MESQVGYERFFGPDDIFFSTTDPKGVIQRSNRTFDTLSRYTRDRVIGAPHNIIRQTNLPLFQPNHMLAINIKVLYLLSLLPILP